MPSEKSLKNLKKFQKGNKANPIGGRAHNPAIKALKKLTIEIYREVIELALTSNLEALKKIAENPNTPAVQVGVAVALVKAIQKGDWNIVNAIAERIVGKIPDKIELSGNVGKHPPTDEELDEIIKRLKSDC